MKKYIPVGLTILLFSFLNFSTYLVGLSHTPPGMLFTGAVHYPPDYYYYLSFITQGWTRWFSNYHLYTGETTSPELIGWFYTLAGHLLLPIFRSPIVVYQLLITFASIMYLIAVYVLIMKLIPQKRYVQLTVFILYLTSATMPQISLTNGHASYTFASAWYNFGNPFERLVNIPHHLIFEAAAIFSLILAFDWWKIYKKTWRLLICMAVFGFILASMQPALWLLVTLVLGIMGLTAPKHKILYALLPAIVVGASGLPFLLYLKYYLYTMPPYSAQLVWEPEMQIATSVWDYITLNGPLVVTAILGLLFWFAYMTREKFTLTLLTALSLLLFFSPIPDRLQILNIRFLSGLPTLFYAAVTGYAVSKIITRFPRYTVSIVTFVLVLIGIAIPLDVQELASRNYLFIPNNAWDYLSTDVMGAFNAAAKISPAREIFLIPYPFDAPFVGLTGRRIYLSQSTPRWTVNFDEKQQRMDDLYSTTTTDEDKLALFKNSHITYVLNFTWIAPPYGGMSPVYHNTLMTLYKAPASP